MHLDRVQILIAQERWEPALHELGTLLTAQPEDPVALALQARCYLELEEFDKAEESARRSIASAPGFDFGFYILGLVLHERGQIAEALQAFHQALEIDPTESDYYGRIAFIHCERKEWAKALEMAERGLEFEADSVLLFNARARALAGLGRLDEARDGLHSHLAEDPNNAFTQANLGWVALERGRPKEALEHFQQALTEEPEMEWARAGLMEALRARNIVYKVILGYFLWMARLPAKTQWGIILGGYVVFRLGQSFARDNPQWSPYFTPFLVLYVAFAYLTWTGTAATNLLLRFSRYGRRLLNSTEIKETTVVGLTWFLALACFIGSYLVGMSLWLPGAVLLIQAIMICTSFRCDAGWPQKTMIAITVVMSTLGLGGYLIAAGSLPVAKTMLKLYTGALLPVILAANYLGSVSVKR